MVILTLLVFLDANKSGVPSMSQQITPSMEVCRAMERIAREDLAKLNDVRWFVIPADIQTTCTPI